MTRYWTFLATTTVLLGVLLIASALRRGSPTQSPTTPGADAVYVPDDGPDDIDPEASSEPSSESGPDSGPDPDRLRLIDIGYAGSHGFNRHGPFFGPPTLNDNGAVAYYRSASDLEQRARGTNVQLLVVPTRGVAQPMHVRTQAAATLTGLLDETVLSFRIEHPMRPPIGPRFSTLFYMHALPVEVDRVEDAVSQSTNRLMNRPVDALVMTRPFGDPDLPRYVSLARRGEAVGNAGYLDLLAWPRYFSLNRRGVAAFTATLADTPQQLSETRRGPDNAPRALFRWTEGERELLAVSQPRSPQDVRRDARRAQRGESQPAATQPAPFPKFTTIGETVAVTEAGDVLFFGTAKPGVTSVVRYDGKQMTRLASPGNALRVPTDLTRQPNPRGELASLGNTLHVDEQDRVYLVATATYRDDDDTRQTTKAIVRLDRPRNPNGGGSDREPVGQVLACVGMPVDERDLVRFDHIHFAGEHVVFTAALERTADEQFFRKAVVLVKPDGRLRDLSSEPLPAGFSLANTRMPLVNRRGEVALDTSAELGSGLLLRDRDGRYHVVARSGMPLLGSQLDQVDWSSFTVKPGQPRPSFSPFNDRGELVFRFDLFDRRRGILLYSPDLTD